jgi:beta-xylosidase
MLEILNSDTDVTYQSKNNNLQNNNNITPFNGEIPPQYMNMNMNQQMNMAQQPQMNNMAAYSPLNYDPMMLQQIAPVQMNQNEDMFTNLNNLNKGPSIGGIMNNNFTSQFQNNALDSAPMQQPNNIASTLGNNINLENLNMLGVSKL